MAMRCSLESGNLAWLVTCIARQAMAVARCCENRLNTFNTAAFT
jgi:hypothetical protein